MPMASRFKSGREHQIRKYEMKRIGLRKQLEALILEHETLKHQFSFTVAENERNLARISDLESNNRWLKTLVQELSGAISNGSKEGSFPRRS